MKILSPAEYAQIPTLNKRNYSVRTILRRCKENKLPSNHIVRQFTRGVWAIGVPDEELKRYKTTMTDQQINIIKRLGLKETDKTIGASLVYGLKIYEYRPGVYLIFGDRDGFPTKESVYVFSYRTQRYLTLSYILLEDAPIDIVEDTISRAMTMK